MPMTWCKEGRRASMRAHHLHTSTHLQTRSPAVRMLSSCSSSSCPEPALSISQVVGGSEAAIIPVGLGGFVACRALSTRNDEPNKASRCGLSGLCTFNDGIRTRATAPPLFLLACTACLAVLQQAPPWCRDVCRRCNLLQTALCTRCCTHRLSTLHHELQAAACALSR